MPLLEVIQTKQVSASIRLSDSTAAQIDQYAAFIRACADDVVEQALTYVFAKDRDFQEFLKTPQAKQVTSTLRIRKVPAVEAAKSSAMKPANGAANGRGNRLCIRDHVGTRAGTGGIESDRTACPTGQCGSHPAGESVRRGNHADFGSNRRFGTRPAGAR